jgi:hypothetical protein
VCVCACVGETEIIVLVRRYELINQGHLLRNNHPAAPELNTRSDASLKCIINYRRTSRVRIASIIPIRRHALSRYLPCFTIECHAFLVDDFFLCTWRLFRFGTIRSSSFSLEVNPAFSRWRNSTYWEGNYYSAGSFLGTIIIMSQGVKIADLGNFINILFFVTFSLKS